MNKFMINKNQFVIMIIQPLSVTHYLKQSFVTK